MMVRTILSLVLLAGMLSACGGASQADVASSQDARVHTGIWKAPGSESRPSVNATTPAAGTDMPRNAQEMVSAAQAKQDADRRCTTEGSGVQFSKDPNKTNPGCGNYKP